VEKLAGMTPEQLMEIPGIGEKMVDKIYQAVNRFYEGHGSGCRDGRSAASGKLQPKKAKLQVQPKLLPQRRQKLPRLLTQLRKIRRRRLQRPLQKLRPPPAKAMRSRRKSEVVVENGAHDRRKSSPN